VATKPKNELEKAIEVAIQKVLGETIPARDAKVKKGIVKASKDISKRYNKVIKQLEKLKKDKEKKEAKPKKVTKPATSSKSKTKVVAKTKSTKTSTGRTAKRAVVKPKVKK
jgi:predicted patatin/cPLA2 family phospholipase